MGIEKAGSNKQLDLSGILKDSKITEEEKEALRNAKISEELINELTKKCENGEDTSKLEAKINAQLNPESCITLDAPKQQQASILGGLGALVTIFLTAIGVISCTPEETYNLGDTILIVNNNVSITVKNDYDKVVEEIQKLRNKVNENNTQLCAKLDTLYELLNDLAQTINGLSSKSDDRDTLLTNIFNAISSIANNQEVQGETFNAILNYLKSFQTELASIKDNDAKFHSEILKKLTSLSGQIAKMDENVKGLFNSAIGLLSSIQDTGTDGVKLLNAILAKIEESRKQNGAMDEKTHSLLETLIKVTTGISGKIDEMSEEQKEVAHVTLNTLYMILDKLNNMDENQVKFAIAVLNKLEEMDVNTQNSFNNVIKLVADGKITDKNILAMLQKISEQIDKIKPAQQLDLNAVLNAIEKLGTTAEAILDALLKGNDLTNEQLQLVIKNQNKQTAQFDELRKLVIENNKIAQGTQDAVKKLEAQNNKDHATIIQLLNKIANNTGNMDDIKAILKEIQTNTKGNWDTSLRIEDKLNLVAQTINVILQTQKDLGDDTKAILLQILAKIPDGCKCEHKDIDLSELLGKLDNIITKLDEIRKDPKHEGILDDLDDYLS